MNRAVVVNMEEYALYTVSERRVKPINDILQYLVQGMTYKVLFVTIEVSIFSPYQYASLRWHMEVHHERQTRDLWHFPTGSAS